jgi:hypothetical protein
MAKLTNQLIHSIGIVFAPWQDNQRAESATG